MSPVFIYESDASTSDRADSPKVNYSSIKALNSAVTEYTYLRKKFIPRLPSLSINKKKVLRVPDAQWCINKSTLLAQQNSSVHTHNVLTTLPNKGFVGDDGNGYVNSILQCLLNSKVRD